MSGLLRRLAGQALGMQSEPATQRVRPATNVHARLPVTAVVAAADAPRSVLPSSNGEIPSSEPRPTVSTPRVTEKTAVIDNGAPIVSREPRRVARSSYHAPAVVRSSQPRWPADGDELELNPAADRAPLPLLEDIRVEKSSLPFDTAALRPLPPAPAIAAARAEPAEVHVHIGRIEVIAPPDSAAAKRNRTTRPRSTLPLSDYLAGRGRP